MPRAESGSDDINLLTDPYEFDLSSLSQMQNPYQAFASLHAAGKEMATRSGLHVVCSYELANQLLRDRRFLSGPIADLYRESLPPGAARDEMAHRINFLDPPDHPRVQRLIMRAFTGRRVRDMLPWVQAQTEKCLDGLEGQLASGADSIDLRAGLAHTIPSLVISEMLGVPLEDRDTLTEWTEAVTPLLSAQIDPADLERGLDAAEKFAAYAADLAEKRRKTPGDDLLTAMLHAEDGQETLSQEELLSLIVTLYSAGHRTTRDLFTNGLFTLLQHPNDYAAIAAESALVPGTVQEFLRFETPTLYVVRIPTMEADMNGKPIAAMTPIIILLGAANRDPAIFADPNHFDIRRNEASPISFSVGPHRCLGAALAQMETEVMLASVTRRWHRLELTADTPRWWGTGPFRGLTHLNVIPG
jgi:cytochrome P450